MSPRAWIVAGVAGVVGLALLFVSVAIATDRPEFCPTCHEMRPFYDAWRTSPHNEVWCIDCHIDQGIPARFAHKWIALREVRAHLAGDTAFPRPAPPEIPDARCVRCHKDVPETTDGFSHADHAEKGSCAQCHIHDGHRVSDQMLKDAGVFAADVSPARLGSRSATVGAGAANLEGHPDIGCTECHDLQATSCSGCHSAPSDPPHDYAQECPACHKPATEWVFIHPTGEETCEECHPTPREHPDTNNRSCATCHTEIGESWDFSHPGKGSRCTDCHARPARHDAGGCYDCHRDVGDSWRFSHPRGSDCAKCHSRPARHASGACATCHRNAGGSWSFRHPGTGGEHSYRSFACKKCHPSSLNRTFCTCHDGNPPEDD